LLRRSFGDYNPLDEQSWRELEEIIGVTVPMEGRSKIDEANAIYTKYAPLHSSKNTIPYGKLKERSQSWTSMTRKVLKDLQSAKPVKPRTMTRDEIISQWRGKRSIKRLMKMTPLEFVAFALVCGVDAVSYALREIEAGHVAMRTDIWSAWVCLIAHTLAPHGVKFSAGGGDKGPGSAFVLGIEFLQDRLQKECRVYSGYDSIRTNAKNAKRSMGHLSETLLWIILRCWGSSTLPATFRFVGEERLESLRMTFDGKEWLTIA